jgi:hypothetical protein
MLDGYERARELGQRALQLSLDLADAQGPRADLPYHLLDCVPFHRLSPPRAIRWSHPIKTVAATGTRLPRSADLK